MYNYIVICMRLKKIKDSDKIVRESKYFIDNPSVNKNNWNKVFGNDSPIEIEIGMGKGDFIISKALNNPNINYIGIEKYDSVLVYAKRKLDNIEIPNLRIINIDAVNLLDIFGEEISKIYLNFSDPWPKKRHTKRRLTYETFLSIYDKVFVNKNVNIEMKTDNDDLFEYSLESFKEHGYKIGKIDRNIDDFYKTEYEKKFMEKGKNINFVSVNN